ncbi:hypothetical protein LTSEADE_3799 [Salmonella enterica subsp. enterica serovar Adelaide str. A4-669]|uniref:Uncharacterized protein n=1 Tax=Salmonella enterica subsp. enterica serovar Adelaide str. A4-669 TaxID=913063 RepID=A0A6C8GJM7_SALET|nr:hypothetical protein LTSEADE_3799 [Salmonella enterica subsp. enterica serovar Adelaide str. A4-669]
MKNVGDLMQRLQKMMPAHITPAQKMMPAHITHAGV